MTDDASPTELGAQIGEPQVPVAAPVAEPAAAGPAMEAPTPPAALPPPPASTPYRTAPEAEALAPFAVPRRASLLGAGLHVFGVLLWGFVVMGELTTSYGPGKHGMLVGEALAVVFVLATSAAAWGVALRRNLEARPPSSPMATYARGAFIAVVAMALWMLVVFCASVFGKAASRSSDGPITMVLLATGIVAALWGRRMAGLRGGGSTSRQRLVVRLLWVAAGLITFVAFVEIIAS